MYVLSVWDNGIWRDLVFAWTRNTAWAGAKQAPVWPWLAIISTIRHLLWPVKLTIRKVEPIACLFRGTSPFCSAHVLKIEGGAWLAATVKFLRAYRLDAAIGTPNGRYKVQGKTVESAEGLEKDAGEKARFVKNFLEGRSGVADANCLCHGG